MQAGGICREPTGYGHAEASDEVATRHARQGAEPQSRWIGPISFLSRQADDRPSDLDPLQVDFQPGPDLEGAPRASGLPAGGLPVTSSRTSRRATPSDLTEITGPEDAQIVAPRPSTIRGLLMMSGPAYSPCARCHVAPTGKESRRDCNSARVEVPGGMLIIVPLGRLPRRFALRRFARKGLVRAATWRPAVNSTEPSFGQPTRRDQTAMSRIPCLD